MTLAQWELYLGKQGLKYSEITDIKKQYNLNGDLSRENWKVKFTQPGESWFNDIMDSTECNIGDLGSFLKLHFLDWEQFVSEYAQYLTEDGLGTTIYCPSTKRVIFFYE